MWVHSIGARQLTLATNIKEVFSNICHLQSGPDILKMNKKAVYNDIDNQNTFGNDACFYYSDTLHTGQNYWCSFPDI